MFGPIHVGTSIIDGEEVQNYLYHIWDSEEWSFDKLMSTQGSSPREGSPRDFGIVTSLGCGTFPQIVMLGFGRVAFCGTPASPSHENAYPCCFYPQIYDPIDDKIAGTLYTSAQCVRAIYVDDVPVGSHPSDKTLFKNLETIPYASVPHHDGKYWFTVGESITEGPRAYQMVGPSRNDLNVQNVVGATFQVDESEVYTDVDFMVDYNHEGYSHYITYSFVLSDMIITGPGFTFDTIDNDGSTNMRAPLPRRPVEYQDSLILSEEILFSGTANSITFFCDPIGEGTPGADITFLGWVTDFWTEDAIPGDVPNFLSARNHASKDWGPAVSWKVDASGEAITKINRSYWDLHKSSLLIDDYGYWVSAIFPDNPVYNPPIRSPLYNSVNCSGFFYPRLIADDAGVFTKNGVTISSGGSETDAEYPVENGFKYLYTEFAKSDLLKQLVIGYGAMQSSASPPSDFPTSLYYQVGLGTFGHTGTVTYYPFFLLRGLARICVVVSASPKGGDGITHYDLEVVDAELFVRTIIDQSATWWWGTDEADIVTRAVIGLCGPDYKCFYGTEYTLQGSSFIYSDDRGVTWSTASGTPPYPPYGYAFRAGNSASGFIHDSGEVWVTADCGRTISKLLAAEDVGWSANPEIVGYTEVLPVGEQEILYQAPATGPEISEETVVKKWVCTPALTTEIFVNTQYSIQSIEWLKFRTNYHKGNETGVQVEAERWYTVDPKYYSVVHGESARVALTLQDGDEVIIPSWCQEFKIRYVPKPTCTLLKKYDFTGGVDTTDLCVLPPTANGFGMDIHPNQLGYMVDYDPEAANRLPETLVARVTYEEYTCFVGMDFSMSPFASGGVDPFKWTATGLPAGLSIAESGSITGMATTEGTYNVTATVEDSQSPKRASDIQFRIVVKILT